MPRGPIAIAPSRPPARFASGGSGRATASQTRPPSPHPLVLASPLRGWECRRHARAIPLCHTLSRMPPHLPYATPCPQARRRRSEGPLQRKRRKRRRRRRRRPGGGTGGRVRERRRARLRLWRRVQQQCAQLAQQGGGRRSRGGAAGGGASRGLPHAHTAAHRQPSVWQPCEPCGAPGRLGAFPQLRGSPERALLSGPGRTCDGAAPRVSQRAPAACATANPARRLRPCELSSPALSPLSSRSLPALSPLSH